MGWNYSCWAKDFFVRVFPSFVSVSLTNCPSLSLISLLFFFRTFFLFFAFLYSLFFYSHEWRQYCAVLSYASLWDKIRSCLKSNTVLKTNMSNKLKLFYQIRYWMLYKWVKFKKTPRFRDRPFYYKSKESGNFTNLPLVLVALIGTLLA